MYLIRLNKLYHFLNDHNATVTIDYSSNGSSGKTTYTAQRKEYNLKDLFSHGCEVQAGALKEITGRRAYKNKNEISDRPNIDESQKDVIRSVHFRFSDEKTEFDNEPPPLTLEPLTKRDLYIKKNFSRYCFSNVRNIYEDAQIDIKHRCLEYLHEIIDKGPGGLDYKVDMDLDIGPFNFCSGIEMSRTEINELKEVVEFWEKSMPERGVLQNDWKDRATIIPGFYSALPFKKEDNVIYQDERKSEQKFSNEQLNLFQDKKSWTDEFRYKKLIGLQSYLFNKPSPDWPKYTKALLILMRSEFAAIKHWIIDTALEEVHNNLEFFMTYSVDSKKGEYVSKYNLSSEDLAEILSEYNFPAHPSTMYSVENNLIVSEPINRFSTMIDKDFLYDKSEHLLFIREKFVRYFYDELCKQFSFEDPDEDMFHQEMKFYLRDVIINDN